MFEPPTIGSTASRNTSTPMPPIQWVKQRQIIEQWLMISTSGMMLAPVVVKPETVSNSASMKRGISPVSTKGMQPNALITIQPSAVATNASRA